MQLFQTIKITMNDNYEHPHKQQVFYILENIPGPGSADDTEDYTELINNFHSQLTTKCDCKKNCFDEQCSCISNSMGRNYTFSNKNDRKTYKLLNDNKSNTIFECNDLCSCINFCGNRLVQKGPCDGLYVKKCEIPEKGVGLYTRDLITKGSFVCEYAGELITKSQAFKRNQSNFIKKQMNFIFCLNEYSNGKVTQTFVDPSCFGNIGRYINHSCDPNCSIIPVRINCPIPKLAIFSLSDILPGQELTIDYGSNNCSSIQDLKGMEVRKLCACNSKRCRGSLPFDSYE